MRDYLYLFSSGFGKAGGIWVGIEMEREMEIGGGGVLAVWMVERRWEENLNYTAEKGGCARFLLGCMIFRYECMEFPSGLSRCV